MTPPTNEETTVNNVWGSSVADGSLVWLTLPSTQTCRALRMGMAGLVKAGVLGEADSLTAFVDKRHIRRVRGGNGVADTEQIDMASIMKDPDALGRILMMVDRVIPFVVKDPVVYRHFTDEPDGTTLRVPDEDREAGAIYTDMIGLEDKMYLFNWTVGGTADATRFSGQSSTVVAGVVDGEDVSRAARRAPRARKKRR